MKDFVENTISIFGNDAVKALTEEVKKRLKVNPDVGEVLYGARFINADDAIKKTGSCYICDALNEFGDELDICVKSNSNAPEKFENHLVWFYSKIDPNVLICNKYCHCNGDFIGVRYKFVKNGKIKTLEEYRLTSEFVAFESEIDELRENDEDSEYITWQDLGDRRFDLGEIVKERFISSYPQRASCVF